jgi:hypothetical protein
MTLNGSEHIHTADPKATAITSVVLRGDTVWCGLTSGRHCLVPFDLTTRQFGEAVDIFPWVDERPQPVTSKIHNGLGILDDGRLVVGEGILYSWDGIPSEVGADRYVANNESRRERAGLPPQQAGVHGLRSLAEFDMRCMSAGKVLLYDPDSGTTELVGQVPKFTYVHSLVVDAEGKRAYGHTIGGCRFFVADLEAKSVEDHGQISTYAFHNLVIAPGGVVYGAWIDHDATGKLRVMRYDPKKGFVERLKEAYLDDPGPRVQGNRGIDQWLVHSSGQIYVGMAGSGLLYRFDPEALTLEQIGRAGEGGRVTSTGEDEHGRVLFSGGFPRMHIGRYDPANGKVEDLGPVTDRYDHIYFHGSVYVDGTLYLAETDSGVPSLWEVKLPE